MKTGQDTLRPSLWERLSRRLTLRKLEWVGTLAPLGFLVVYHYLLVGPAHDVLHSPWGLLLLVALLGALTAAFSRLMFRVIGKLQRDVQVLSQVAASQNAQLRALNEANLTLSQERLVFSVLQRVVDISRELVQARYAALSVLDDGGKKRAFYTSGIDQRTRQALGALPVGEGLLGVVLRQTAPLRLERIADHPESVGFPPNHPPMTSFLGVAIRYKDQAVGSLYLTEKEGGGHFTATDEEIVQLFASQAAVAIYNAHLSEQIQALAVETERIRISHEMHDGLAQVLGYFNTKAQAVEVFLSRGEVSVAQEGVRELGQAARKAYQDIREGILALRAQVGTDRSLQEVLEEYVSEYRLQFRIPVQVRWQLHPEDLAWSPLQEVQLLRIIQEALTNVRKHAEATEVTVALMAHDGDLQVEVRDNGRGFNPLAIKRGEWPHLGLQTMQERAEGVGGIFEVDSSPGRGTLIRVRLPRAVHPRPNRGTP